MKEYESTIEKDSLDLTAASLPEIQEYEGQSFGPDVDTSGFHMHDALLLGFNHRNCALRNLWLKLEKRQLQTVSSAVEKGIYICRKWKKSLPRDAGDLIANRANKFHGGAKVTVIEILKIGEAPN